MSMRGCRVAACEDAGEKPIRLRPRQGTKSRSRAVNLRATATDKTAGHIREPLLALADTYERLASILEGIHASEVAREQADIPIAAYKPPR
jgi:hypothetical protein